MAQRAAPFEPKDDNKHDTQHNEQTAEDVEKRNIVKPKGSDDAHKTESNGDKKATGLFSNLGQPSNGGSIFNNSNVNLPQPGGFLFGGANTTNLFANKSNLFANQSSLFNSASTGLFNNAPKEVAPTGGSLFSIQFNQPKNESDEEGEGDDEPLKASDDEKKEIVMKYEYKKTTEQIVKFPLVKFRKNENDVLERGSVAIEKVAESDNFLVIYRNNIQNILYQGFIVGKLSKVSGLGQKKENLVLQKLLGVKESDEKEKEEKKTRTDTVKLMFENVADAEQFKNEFEKHIEKKE